jgi:hypothetical protein
MRRFVEGVDRGQRTLFPECLEDWIDEGNPVRAIVPPANWDRPAWGIGLEKRREAPREAQS